MFGTCQVSGDTGMPLVKSGKRYVIQQIKDEDDRHKVKPTDGDRYRDWKKQWDRWTTT